MKENIQQVIIWNVDLDPLQNCFRSTKYVQSSKQLNRPNVVLVLDYSDGKKIQQGLQQ